MDMPPLPCRRRGCKLMIWKDDVNMRFVIQHGDNPEAVLLLSDHDMWNPPQPSGMSYETAVSLNLKVELLDWVNRVHRYQDAAPPEGAGENG
jgi:hypothetical protein